MCTTNNVIRNFRSTTRRLLKQKSTSSSQSNSTNSTSTDINTQQDKLRMKCSSDPARGQANGLGKRPPAAAKTITKI